LFNNDLFNNDLFNNDLFDNDLFDNDLYQVSSGPKVAFGRNKAVMFGILFST
jgi:hypothetical protein